MENTVNTKKEQDINNAIKKDKSINADRLRYEKNSFPALMCYLAIVFNVIYFVTIYKINDTYFYTMFMAVSVVCNLIFLLFSFLSSVEIKSYKKKFAYIMIALGILQVVRIFIYPVKAHAAISTTNVGEIVMNDKKFVLSIIYLVISAAAMFVGAIIGIIRCNKLEKRLNEIKKEG